MVMKETVNELVKRFHVQLDYTPQISLFNRDKEVALEIPSGVFKKLGQDVKRD